MADSCVFVERDVLEIGRRPRMNDSHTCDICGEVRACGLLCKCERGETSKDTELAALRAEVAALKAEVERLKLSEARVKELEHERNKAMGERNRALTREKEANEGWSQAQARVKELEASEKQHDADTDLPIPEGNCLACKGTGMRGPDWICGACAGSGIVRPSDD